MNMQILMQLHELCFWDNHQDDNPYTTQNANDLSAVIALLCITSTHCMGWRNAPSEEGSILVILSLFSCDVPTAFNKNKCFFCKKKPWEKRPINPP